MSVLGMKFECTIVLEHFLRKKWQELYGLEELFLLV